ncbi:succinate dehydrogenase and fumarate reductase iron-sulfur protein [Haladaptatus paucihalophilus DX253]|nr:succinate dehydrogenase/fumarate reductase iron-sulfur subunit [Haladaptatus paucihalophilus]EFW93551.1 succinate dehydrogenase and fumarate reductase iron-sulfur protein [Haladaptatus paucihalophilus DX253]
MERQESEEEVEQAGRATESSPQQRRLERKARRRREREAEAERAAESRDESVHLKVFRYDPDVPEKQKPRFDHFYVPDKRGLTVLDALIYARDHFDSTLTVRHSCRQAICGSDAVFINGSQRLACQTQVSDLDSPVQVEPLPHQEVIKDLVVEMEHFYDQMHAVEPYFQTDEKPDDDLEEQRQSRENREEIKTATRCIWCGACMSSCNIAAGDNRYLGPAAINAAYRFAMDEREGESVTEHRLNLMDQEHGVWRCQTQFSCTNVCPKDIPLTQHIQELKREAVKKNLTFW